MNNNKDLIGRLSALPPWAVITLGVLFAPLITIWLDREQRRLQAEYERMKLQAISPSCHLAEYLAEYQRQNPPMGRAKPAILYGGDAEEQAKARAEYWDEQQKKLEKLL